MKKIISFLVSTLILATSFIPAYATNISINNQNVQFTEVSGVPFLDSANRTQVPFRQTMEAFGCSVSWDSEKKIAIAEKDGISVQVPIGTSYILKNGQQIPNDTVALIINNKTYLPIRAVLEAFGAQVIWDSKTQTVLVFTDSQGKIMTVHFIDVGQADSIFIDFGDYEALIDGGNNADGVLVVNYIKQYVDGNLDLVMATHAHEDHIGGLDNVLNEYSVTQLIDSGDHSDSATFNDYITAVSNETNINYMADEDIIIELGGGAVLKIIDDLDGDSNVNNNSVIALLDYNNFEALLPGDAESAAEEACLNDLYDVDVLKAGHHGSRTASSENFLNVIKPESVIISAGLDNSYGHPHIEALQRFANIGADVYGTFKSGTIVLTTNGDTYNIIASEQLTINDTGAKSTNITNANNGTTQSEMAYIGNSNTMKFHRADCTYVSSISQDHVVYLKQRTDALSQGYVPCKRCNP